MKRKKEAIHGPFTPNTPIRPFSRSPSPLPPFDSSFHIERDLLQRASHMSMAWRNHDALLAGQPRGHPQISPLRLNVSHLNEKKHRELPTGNFSIRINTAKRRESSPAMTPTKTHIRTHSGKRYSSKIYKRANEDFGYEPAHEILGDIIVTSPPKKDKASVKMTNLSFNGSNGTMKVVNVNETRLLHDGRRHSSVGAGHREETSQEISPQTLPLNMSNAARRNSEKLRHEQLMYQKWKTYTENTNRRVQEMKDNLKRQEMEKNMLVAQMGDDGNIRFLSIAEFDYWQSQKKLQEEQQQVVKTTDYTLESSLSHAPQPNETPPPPRRVSVVTVDASAELTEDHTDAPRLRTPLLKRPKTPPSFWNSSRRRTSTPLSASKGDSSPEDRSPTKRPGTTAGRQRSVFPAPPSLREQIPPRPLSQATVRRFSRDVTRSSVEGFFVDSNDDFGNTDRSSSAPLLRAARSPKRPRGKSSALSQISVSSSSMTISERSNLRSRGAGAYYRKFTPKNERPAH